jgi:hypothetical protein
LISAFNKGLTSETQIEDYVFNFIAHYLKWSGYAVNFVVELLYIVIFMSSLIGIIFVIVYYPSTLAYNKIKGIAQKRRKK